jgi:hypothetical protein
MQHESILAPRKAKIYPFSGSGSGSKQIYFFYVGNGIQAEFHGSKLFV